MNFNTKAPFFQSYPANFIYIPAIIQQTTAHIFHLEDRAVVLFFTFLLLLFRRNMHAYHQEVLPSHVP